MSPGLWLVATLSISLPPAYQLRGNSSEQLAAPIPSQTAHQDFWRWEAPGGRALHLFYWQPQPARDLGPMHIVAEWPATVAGQPTKIYETDLFMGVRQWVLVVYLRWEAPQPVAQAMLYAKGISHEEFAALLAGVRQR